jgi:hypothetical protein
VRYHGDPIGQPHVLTIEVHGMARRHLTAGRGAGASGRACSADCHLGPLRSGDIPNQPRLVACPVARFHPYPTTVGTNPGVGDAECRRRRGSTMGHGGQGSGRLGPAGGRRRETAPRWLDLARRVRDRAVEQVRSQGSARSATADVGSPAPTLGASLGYKWPALWGQCCKSDCLEPATALAPPGAKPDLGGQGLEIRRLRCGWLSPWTTAPSEAPASRSVSSVSEP